MLDQAMSEAQADPGPIATALLGGTPLGREGLRQFLAGTHYRLLAEAEAEAASSPREGAARLHLILLEPARPEGRPLGQEIAALKAGRDSKVVLIGEIADALLLEAMAAGADGVLSGRCERAALLLLLDRVVAGDLVYAVRPLVELIRSAVPLPLVSETRSVGLTPRERTIAALLVKGASNKRIARHCGVSENTIKIQIRGLLLKLGVATRTQAALALLEKEPQKTSKHS